jgi:hypothetical protein
MKVAESTEFAEFQAVYCLGEWKRTIPTRRGRVGLIPKG